MSDELVLSDELIADVRAAMAQHDARASEGIVGVQYAAAVMGFMLGEMQVPEDKKQELFDYLGSFAVDVMRQVEQRDAPAQPEPPAEDAFGVWKPGDQ